MKTLERPPEYVPLTVDNYTRVLNLLDDKRLHSVLNNIHEEYYYWDKVKYQPCPDDVTHEELWAITRTRRVGASVISFGKHKFKWNTTNKMHGYTHFLDMHAGGTLDSPATVTKQDKNRYMISSLMEEAIASSQIEGAITTRKKAKEMLRKNEKPKDKSEQMILNNYITIQKILEIKDERLTKENLLALHKLVTTNTMENPAEEGALRVDNEVDVIDVETDEIVYHPPNADEIDEMLNDLFAFFNDEDTSTFIHPLVKASILHFMIGYIHPFADGNGRTGRALFYWYLLKKGYWLTEYLSISRLILRAKTQYARAFQYVEVDDNDLTYFVLFNLKTMQLAFEELLAYIKRKNEEKMEVSNIMRAGGINYKQALILEWFHKDPSLMLTTKETETRLAISAVGARKNLMHLVELGYVEMIDLDKKTNGFVRAGDFEKLIGKK